MTITLLEINLDIRRARDAMDDVSLAVGDRPTSDMSVEAKAEAISPALKHHTPLNTTMSVSPSQGGQTMT